MNSSPHSSAFDIRTILGDKIDDKNDGPEGDLDPFGSNANWDFGTEAKARPTIAQIMAANFVLGFNRHQHNFLFPPTFPPNFPILPRLPFPIFPPFLFQSPHLGSFEAADASSPQSQNCSENGDEDGGGMEGKGGNQTTGNGRQIGGNKRIGHPYQSRQPPSQKKPRTSFTKGQVAILERRFADQKYLASTERAHLAAQLQMDDAQVKTWFQNRRTKWRRQEAEEREFGNVKNKIFFN